MNEKKNLNAVKCMLKKNEENNVSNWRNSKKLKYGSTKQFACAVPAFNCLNFSESFF